MYRNAQLKAEEASFRQAREKLLEDLERRVKEAKAALASATTALKKEERLSQVWPTAIMCISSSLPRSP